MEQAEQQDKKGSVLLLTLIITMIILTSSVVLGTLIIGSLRRSQEESASMAAYYAAESLMEKTLYDLRKNKSAPSQIKIINGVCPDIIGAPSSYSCKVDTTETGVQFPGTSYGTIVKNQKKQFRLFDPQGTADGTLVETIKFRCGSSAGNPWLEVTATVISAGGSWVSDPVNHSPKKYLFPCTSASYDYTVTFDTDFSYNVEVKALYSDAPTVYAEAFKADGTRASLSDNYEIVASVDYSAFSRQSIKVQISGASTVSSLFDNVLYSELEITKDILPGTSP